jgi:hypothetical protein
LVATNDQHEFLVLDRNGHQLDKREVGTQDWSVIGWQGGKPIVTSIVGARWVEPFIYSLFDGQLHRYDPGGNLLAKVAIPRELFEAQYLHRPDLATWPDAVLFPARFDLNYHAQRQRFIASHWALLAWTLCLHLDGTVDWVTLAGDSCCNSTCFVGDTVTVHTSSCGARVSFLAADGVVVRSHQIEGVSRAFPDGRGAVCVVAENTIHMFDEHGEGTWKLDVPNLSVATARNGVLYTLNGETNNLVLTAFEIG